MKKRKFGIYMARWIGAWVLKDAKGDERIADETEARILTACWGHC